MEELCARTGGYGRFFRTLVILYVGWWVAVGLVLFFLLDHHRCEAQLPALAWLLYSAVVVAMLVLTVLLELAMIQRIGLLKAASFLELFSERRWQIPLISTVLWKLDAYMDVAFIFVARDCGSSLWQASFATVIFAVLLGQLLLNSFFAFTDCDHELPASLGFFMLDFKLMNTAVRAILPFDPDSSLLPVARPVTLRTARRLVGLEKVVSDIAQVSIQIVYLENAPVAQTFVLLSVLVGILHGSFSVFMVVQECVQDERVDQARRAELCTALLRHDTALLPCESIRSIEARAPGPAPSIASVSKAPAPSLQVMQIPDLIEIPDLL